MIPLFIDLKERREGPGKMFQKSNFRESAGSLRESRNFS